MHTATVAPESSRVRLRSRLSPSCFPAFITREQTSALMALGLSRDPAPSTVETDYREVRRSLEASIAWETLSGEALNAINQLENLVHMAYKYDLYDEHPEISFLRYAKTEFFDWHHDVSEKTERTRKLSFSIQLSASDDYEGGDLEFACLDALAQARTLGTLLVFPAFNMHRVRPVTRGARFSLVGWFYGPPFR